MTGSDSSFVVLVLCVLFLLWQVKMLSAVKKAYKSDSFGKIAHNINMQEKKHAVHVL